ncbi:DUF6731 family protein [Halobacillus sp. B29]|uniref:DUF6731 family protein n=1 Tax=Halobacillus sp. B29 TaxID=3457432 RepID=UPI003FCE8547
MSRTVKFYQVAIYENEEKTNIPVGKFLDLAGLADWVDRLRRIDGYPTAIKKIDLHSKNPNYRILPFVKYRQDYKPYLGDIQSPQELDEVKKDIIEMVTIVHDENTDVFAIEGSMHGVKQSGIEKYLNTFLPKDENGYPEFQIVLSPIMSYKGMEDLKSSSQIRSIELTLSLSEYHMGHFEDSMNEDEKPANKVLSSLRKIGSAKEELEANKVRMVFGVDNGKHNTMRLDAALAMLEMLQMNMNSVDTLKVRYRDSETGELDNADLKNNGGPLKDKIFENNPASYPGWQLVGAEIINTIHSNLGTLNKAYTSFTKDKVRYSVADNRRFLDTRLIVKVEDKYKVIEDEPGGSSDE